MAEADKSGSSPSKAKSKKSFLDDDISDDFLTSWKSVSVKGGDDMDFDFEPIKKGKNKSFDFGMDMDFSLDDAFGKMSSFKFDMPDIDFSNSPKKSSKPKVPDIDFSNSPKKSSKSKEKNSEEKSTKGNGQEKNAKFDFSFDFSGDGFNIEKGESRTTTIVNAVPSGGGKAKDHLLDNGNASVDIKSSVATVKEMGKHCDGNPSSHGKELMKQGSTVGKGGKNADASRNGVDKENEEIKTKMVVDSLPSDGQEEKDEPRLLDNKGMSTEIKPSRNKEIAFVEVFGKIPSLKLDTLDTDRCASSKKPSNFNEKSSSEESHKGTCQEKIDKLSSVPHMTVKLDAAPVTEEDKVVEVASNAEIQSGSNANPTPSESQPTVANPISTQYQVSGANNFSRVRGTADGTGIKLPIADRKREGSTPVGASDLGDGPSHEQDMKEFDDNHSSRAKEILKQAPALVEREKTADISRNVNNNSKIRTDMAVPPVPHNGEAKKYGLHLPNNKKMSTDDSCLGIQRPSSAASKGGSKSSNQGYEKLDGKISSTSTVKKSNVPQENRPPFAKIMPSLSSLRMPSSLPSLKTSRNITPNKQVSPLVMKESNSTGNLEKSPKLQVTSKKVPPVNVQKQTPPMPSLKRKSSEAADLHPSKRHPPSEIRKSKVSATEAVNNVTRSTDLEVRPRATVRDGSGKKVVAKNQSPKPDFRLETNMENLTLMESDDHVQKAQACAKELDDLCVLLKKKHNEAKELLVRAIVNNNNLLLLNHTVCEEKVHEAQRFASRLMSRARGWRIEG